MSITDNRKRNRILTVLFIGVLMGALDIAIVAPALPALQAGFGVGDRILAWTFTIYVLFNLIGTPLMAKLSDQDGPAHDLRAGRRPLCRRLAGRRALAELRGAPDRPGHAGAGRRRHLPGCQRGDRRHLPA